MLLSKVPEKPLKWGPKSFENQKKNQASKGFSEIWRVDFIEIQNCQWQLRQHAAYI